MRFYRRVSLAAVVLHTPDAKTFVFTGIVFRHWSIGICRLVDGLARQGDE